MKFKRYTIGEEIFSSVTHGIGTLLAVGGTAVLIVLSAIYSDVWSVVGSAIFGASLIILYCMSTLYHSITNEKAKKFFRIMDHNTIFFLIAGTYTPITISILRGWIGWVLFGIVWGAAIIGIILNSIDLEKFRKPSVVCYIAIRLFQVWKKRKAVGWNISSAGGLEAIFFSDGEILMIIFIIGGMIFHKFWEASGRYTMRYYLTMLPLAAEGADMVMKKMSHHRIHAGFRQGKANE